MTHANGQNGLGTLVAEYRVNAASDQRTPNDLKEVREAEARRRGQNKKINV